MILSGWPLPRPEYDVLTGKPVQPRHRHIGAVDSTAVPVKSREPVHWAHRLMSQSPHSSVVCRGAHCSGAPRG